MKATRLFTGKDGQSHFEDIEIPIVFGSWGGGSSDPIETQHVMFGEIEITEIPKHNSPCSQYVIMLQGAMEIEIGDGTRRIFKEGEVLLAEDTTGEGHMTRAASDGLRRYLVIQKK